MGNWLSCFHSSKSKSNANTNAADGRDDSVVARVPVEQGNHLEHQGASDALSQNPIRISTDSETHSSHISNLTVTKKSICLLNGNSKNLGDTMTTAVKEHHQQVSDNTVNALFEKYKDEFEDAILSEGIERLCNDLGYKPDDFAILVLAWSLDASQMCRFTRSEFIQGLQAMNADTIEDIRMRLEQTIEKLKVNSEMFKQLYRFTFRFGLEPDNRIVLLEMAIILWRLVFTVHKPHILDRWLKYLEKHSHQRGIPKDTWNMFLNFAETCDISTYDDTEAWPSLFDDFVEHENERLNQLHVANDNDNKERDNVLANVATASGRASSSVPTMHDHNL